MIIPLDKLLVYNGNKYEFTRATMNTFEKVGNIREYPEEDSSWKVVPNIINLALNGYFQYEPTPIEDIEQE